MERQSCPFSLLGMPLEAAEWQVCPDIDPFNPQSDSTGPEIVGAPCWLLRATGSLVYLLQQATCMCTCMYVGATTGKRQVGGTGLRHTLALRFYDTNIFFLYFLFNFSAPSPKTQRGRDKNVVLEIYKLFHLPVSKRDHHHSKISTLK